MSTHSLSANPRHRSTVQEGRAKNLIHIHVSRATLVYYKESTLVFYIGLSNMPTTLAFPLFIYRRQVVGLVAYTSAPTILLLLRLLLNLTSII